jgi:hypothetical protein
LLEENSSFTFCTVFQKWKDGEEQTRQFRDVTSEMRKNCKYLYDENDLEDGEIVFNWFIRERINHLLSEDIDFFFDILDDYNW